MDRIAKELGGIEVHSILDCRSVHLKAILIVQREAKMRLLRFHQILNPPVTAGTFATQQSHLPYLLDAVKNGRFQMMKKSNSLAVLAKEK